jgi:hypothetical protein
VPSYGAGWRTADTDALWPVLKAKIEACAATGDFSTVLVAAAVWRAAELARQPRRNVAVRPAS